MQTVEFIEFPLLGVIPDDDHWAKALAEASEHISLPRSLVPPGCTPENSFILRLSSETIAPFGTAAPADVLFQLDAKVEPGNIVAVASKGRLDFGHYIPTPDAPMIMRPAATVAESLPEGARIVAKVVKAIVDL